MSDISTVFDCYDRFKETVNNIKNPFSVDFTTERNGNVCYVYANIKNNTGKPIKLSIHTELSEPISVEINAKDNKRIKIVECIIFKLIHSKEIYINRIVGIHKENIKDAILYVKYNNEEKEIHFNITDVINERC